MQTFSKNTLCKALGLNPETLRYYEKIGLLTAPKRSANGYRLFTEQNRQELNFIKTCRSLGFSLDEIKQLKALQQNPENSCYNADDLVEQHLALVEQKIQQLIEIKQSLQALTGCQRQQIEQCKVIRTLTNAENASG
ncbi:MerR family DNA-binding protein [Ursidibacter sp. B-7004-1]